MFERYSERARRVLFFARYELTSLGGTTIEPEHLLLALLRDANGGVGRLFAQWNLPVPEIRRTLEERLRRAPKIPTSIEVPFAKPTKRILNFAAEEADRLRQPTIEAEHLLLAILRENDPVGAASLTAHGLSLTTAREYLATHPPDETVEGRPAVAARHIGQITELVHHLAKTKPNTAEAEDLVRRIEDELLMLRTMLG